MTNLLNAMLAHEAAGRVVEAAIRESEDAERSRVIQAIHAAFEPYGEQIAGLALIGDYGRPVVAGTREAHRARVVTDDGLTLCTGATIAKSDLRLSVYKREGATAGRVTLWLQQHGRGAESKALEDFSLETAPEHMLKSFFAAMMPFLHKDSFPAEEPVAV